MMNRAARAASTARRSIFARTLKTNRDAIPIRWHTLGIIIFGGTLAYSYFQYIKDKRRTTVQHSVAGGAPLLGGEFDLVDETGKRVTSQSLRGQYLLLYFGFTYCPDICPAELAKMMAVLRTLKNLPTFPLIRPIFISVDPERDTPARIKEFKKNFPPEMLWLTGTRQQLDEAALAYRCYYSIPSKEEKESDKDYLVDHSIFFYLVNPEGQFLDYFSKSMNASEVSIKIEQLIEADRAKKK